MMRLKLLCVLLPLITFGVAAAGMSQLSNVSVAGEGNVTTITLQASGAFTHNEYRPTDDLLLIDLVGVSAGKHRDRVRSLQAPGIKQYRVLGFSGVGNAQIARLELTLDGRPDVQVSEGHGGLVIRIARVSGTAAPDPGAASANDASPAPAPARPMAPAAKAAAATVLEVRKLAVVRGRDGLDGIEVEVTGSGPLVPRTMVLTAPDRFILDLPGAVPGEQPRNIAVNAGDIRDIRMGRFQADPPITRVVIDLAAPHQFQVASHGNAVTLRLASSSSAVADAGKKAPEAALADKPGVEDPAAASTKAAPAEGSPARPPLARWDGAPSMPEIGAVADAKANVEPEYKGAAKDVVVVEPTVQERRGSASDNPSAPNAGAPGTPSDAQPEAARLMAANLAPLSTPAMAAPLTQAAQAPAPPSQPAAQAAPAPPAPPQAAVNFAAEQRQQAGQPAPASTPRYTGEPISVNLKDVDLKDFFRLIHEISGLNVVLDPGVAGSLTIVLDDVPWDQALDIVLKNNGLDRQLEGNVLRIASMDSFRKEAEARRRQVEAQALAVDKITATRFLSYAHSKDVLPTIKKLLSPRGEIVSDERTNALIISDIPSVMPAIDSLLVQLDRKTQQVEIEARVVAATRTFAREIGSQFAFGWGNHPSAVGGAVGSSPVIEAGGGTPLYLQSAPGSIPLFSDLRVTQPTSGLTFSNFSPNVRIDAILTAAESRGLIKILSRPRIITQNNILAVVKQGQKIPIVTQAQLGGPPTTTLMEAVLRLTVTPQITVENTIFLKVDVENTTPDFSNEVLGVPSFFTQQATTQVLVTDGGTAVIGGVVQSSNSVNVEQVPLLGNIPGLGNLFKHRSVKTSTQELIFFITPRIVET